MSFRALHQTRNFLEDGFASMITNNSDLSTARFLDKKVGVYTITNPLQTRQVEMSKRSNRPSQMHDSDNCSLARALNYSSVHAGSS